MDPWIGATTSALGTKARKQPSKTGSGKGSESARTLFRAFSKKRTRYRPRDNMVANGGTPPRGSAAAAASLRRRRTGGGGAPAAGGANTMLQFYTDDATGLKIMPNTVLIMSIGFIAFVAILHVLGKFYFVPKDLGRS